MDSMFGDDSNSGTYLQGTVKCQWCLEQWYGVWPVETHQLECPRCGLMSDADYGLSLRHKHCVVGRITIYGRTPKRARMLDEAEGEL